MKKLSEINKEDAIKVLKVGYPHFFYTGKWVLEDATKDIKEPCKKLSGKRLSGKYKAFVFWFFDNQIDIDCIDDDVPMTFDDVNYDVKLSCYVKALELGYHIKELKHLLDSTVFNPKNK